MKNPVLVVFRKELLDSLRDRRSLFSALLYPLFGPILVAAMFGWIVKTRTSEGTLQLPVVGRDNAPSLVRWLEEHDVELVSPPADPEGAVQQGELKAVLVIPDDFAADFRALRPAKVQLIVDDSRQDAAQDVARTRRLLDAYGRAIGALRLVARGVDPAVARPIVVEDVDLATPQKLAANVLNMLPMFVLMAAFIGGMYVATDSTAGERERGSLEPLLVNPVRRRALVLGKWLATISFGTVAVILTVVFTVLALRQVPLEGLGISLSVGFAEGLGIVGATLPLALLAGAVQLLVATFARSFKEAQSYLSLLLLVPMLPAILLSLEPLRSVSWMMVVPFLAQQVLLMDVLRGEPTSWLMFVLAAISAIALSLVAVFVTAALFRRERIVFGR